MVKRCAEIAIEIHHHLGDTALRRIDAGLFRAEAELVAQRGLNAIAIQNLAFDFRCLDRLFTDDVDFQSFLIVRAYMLVSAHEFPRLDQELLFQRLQYR